MYTQTHMPKFILIVVVSLLMLALTACGSSAYADALNPAIDQFNAATNTVNVQIDALIADNGLFENAAWKSETVTALSTLKGTAQALSNLPAPEEEYTRLNALVQELASKTILATDTYKAAIEAQDTTMWEQGGPYLDRINELLPQINAEIDRLNQ